METTIEPAHQPFQWCACSIMPWFSVPEDRRQLADFRRSGTVEALAGGVAAEQLSSKMANSISESNRLHKTYAPVQLAAVRSADEARKRGRASLREQKPDKSLRASPTESYTTVQRNAKPL